MDFTLTKEQTDIQRAAAEFAKGEFDPDVALEYDQNQTFPSALWKKACDLGFVGIHFPEEYGGQGLGVLENVLVTEAFCRQDSGMGTALALSDLGSEMILRHGDEKQREAILPYVSQGKGLVTIAFLEDGYSLAPLSSTATRSDTEYIIHGNKNFVTLAGLADYIIVVCQSRSDVPLSQSVLLLERGTDGIEVAGMGDKVGMRMVPVDRVSFNHVRTAQESRVGPEGKGYFQLQAFLDEVRIESGGMGVGIAQGGLDRALEYSRKREQFGRTIAKFDAIRNKLADMYAEVEMARLITYKAAWSFDHGRPDSGAILLSKMISSRAACRVTHDAIQIYGGLGYMTESHIEHFYRDAKVLDLFLEPGQIQRNRLADQMTGKRKSVRRW